jgi:hypothetical protein
LVSPWVSKVRTAWSGLPVEDVCVWIAITYATVIVYEVMKALVASERSVRDTLLGSRED